MFSTPILFIVFNRPQETKLVFEKIREIKPKKLYIVADGPRASKPGEEELCNKVRSIIGHIDWDCDVKTDFKIENVGPEVSIKNALNWFFSEVDYGIVLEDDCLPSYSFFTFCDILLKKYAFDERINMVSGSTFCKTELSFQYNYFIGEMGSTWGWASWSRVFKNFKWGNQYELKEVHDKMISIYGNKYTEWLFSIIKHSYEKEGNWDVEFFAHNLMNEKKAITPSVNLISNIGNTGTHFINSANKRLLIPAIEMEFNNTFEEKYTEMPMSIKNKIIKSVLEKENSLTFRDRLYLLKMRILSFLR